ncbi:MAG TPA: pilus assembly protein PilP [Gammaproteobacteria bacterium]|nr:pilus assembly protein PilP [Gammaproteobacteria bacterium]
MLFRYRYIIAILIIIIVIFITYYYDTKPLQHEIALARQAQQLLRDELTAYTIAANQAASPQQQASGQIIKPLPAQQLADLSAQIQAAGLTLITVKTISYTSAYHYLKKIMRSAEDACLKSAGDIVHVVMHGDFKQLTKLAELFFQQGTFLILDFSYQASQPTQFIFEADLLLGRPIVQPVPAALLPEMSQLPTKIQDPFCFGEQTFKRPSAVYLLTTIPLAQIKMLGFLQQGKQQQALLLLPNQQLVAVDQHAVLGKERGIIRSITQTQLVVELPDNIGSSQQVILRILK